MGDFGRPPPDTDSMVSLKVDNLSYRTKPEHLLEEFRKFGEVGDIYIPRDRDTKESRGFAFVRYYDRRDAERAMEKMDGEIFDDRELRVQKAKYGRPSRPPPYRGRYDDERSRYDGGRGGYGYDRGYSRYRRSRSHSRSPRRRRRSLSRSPRRRSPSRSRSRSPRSPSPGRSRSRSRPRSPVGSRSPIRSRTPEQDRD